MNDLKENMQKKIAKDKEESIVSYNKQLDKVSELEDFSELFDLIVDVYSDPVEREDAIIDLMRLSLQNEFFREAEIIRQDNALSFSNGEYSVSFNTLGLKTIELSYHAGSNPEKVKRQNPVLSEEEEKHKEDLLDKFKVFSINKTFRNFKKLSNTYNKDSDKGKIYQYIRTVKECNPKLEQKIRIELKDNENRKNINLYALEVYKVKEEKALRFLSKLTDLIPYKNNDWKFLLINETGATQINNEDIQLTEKRD